jgi:hypothetical protein
MSSLLLAVAVLFLAVLGNTLLNPCPSNTKWVDNVTHLDAVTPAHAEGDRGRKFRSNSPVDVARYELS